MKQEPKNSIDEKRMADWEYIAEICCHGSLTKLQKLMFDGVQECKDRDKRLASKLNADCDFIQEILDFKYKPKSEYAKLIIKLCNFTNDWQEGKGSAPSFKDADVMLTDAICAIRDLSKEVHELKKLDKSDLSTLIYDLRSWICGKFTEDDTEYSLFHSTIDIVEKKIKEILK